MIMKTQTLRAFVALLLSIGTIKLAQAKYTSKFCTSNPTAHYCVDISLDPVADIANITVSTDQTGWAAVGIGGTTMVGPTLYVGWYNDSGYPVVSERMALAHSMPQLTADQSFTILPSIPSDVVLSPWVNMVFSIQRSVSSDGKFKFGNGSDPSLLVYAYSHVVPVDRNFYNSSFRFHDAAAGFILDFDDDDSMTGGGGGMEEGLKVKMPAKIGNGLRG
ncbi:hypothetical protein HDU76_013358 [Blyttiomyces sp. JEL0837]|nr:hypothetical protein HDU76_013358 [Blyttiomyces sp. JEL0837]